MPTLVQRYINPASSGGDGTTNATSGANAAFASMNAAGNAISGRDLVTNDELWQFECATTGGAADATQVITLGSGAGIVTDATRYVRFYPAAGHEALATGWDANRYRLSTSSTVGILFALGVENILFEDLQLECTADDSDGEIVRASGTFGATFGVRFIGCRFRGASGQTNPREAARVTSWTGKWVFANCVFERFATAVLCHFPGASTQLVVHNCTGAGVAGGNGIEFFGSGLDATTILSVRNTILYGYDADLSVTLGGASNESANNLAADPTFTNAGSGDYSIGTGSAAEDAGGDLSANTRYAVTDDIAGTSRPQNSVFDIGAFEIVAGGGPFEQSITAAATNAGEFGELRLTSSAMSAACANSGAWSASLNGGAYTQSLTAACANSSTWSPVYIEGPGEPHEPELFQQSVAAASTNSGEFFTALNPSAGGSGFPMRFLQPRTE
jgi:hypothetical protein